MLRKNIMLGFLLALGAVAGVRAANAQVYYYDYPAGPLALPADALAAGLEVGTLGLFGPGPAYPVRYAYPGGYYGYGNAAVAACASRFVSFDPATGTYMTYSGVRVLCPYLRAAY